MYKNTFPLFNFTENNDEDNFKVTGKRIFPWQEEPEKSCELRENFSNWISWRKLIYDQFSVWTTLDNMIDNYILLSILESVLLII